MTEHKSLDARYEDFVTSYDPERFFDHPEKQRQAVFHLEELRQIFRSVEREDLEDELLDILDACVGYCTPHYAVDWKKHKE